MADEVSSASGLPFIWHAMAELRLLVDETPGATDLDRAEGQAFIAGLYKWGMDRVFLASDPLRPRFVRFTDTISNWGFPNPDNFYLVAEIAENETYVIRGQRGSCMTFVVEVRNGIGRREDNVHSRRLAHREAHELKLAPDGTFEIRLGGEPGAENHLPLPAGATTIMVRATFSDWSRETLPPMTIQRLGAPAPPEPRASRHEMDARLGRVGQIMLTLGRFNDSVARDWAAKTPVNAFPAAGNDITLAAFPGQRSSVARYHLPDLETALLVEMTPLECAYLGFSLGHLLWYTNLDYRGRQSCLNNFQAQRSSDGGYRFVLSAIDPGVPNWIDTAGRDLGFMFFRCQGLVGDQMPQPRARLIPVSETLASFPADEPRVTPEERAEAIAARRLAVDLRYAY
jgi:hypothetical protein